jgi:hypothetical protein
MLSCDNTLSEICEHTCVSDCNQFNPFANCIKNQHVSSFCDYVSDAFAQENDFTYLGHSTGPSNSSVIYFHDVNIVNNSNSVDN